MATKGTVLRLERILRRPAAIEAPLDPSVQPASSAARAPPHAKEMTRISSGQPEHNVSGGPVFWTFDSSLETTYSCLLHWRVTF